MLGALREREQPDLPAFPKIELRHGPIEQGAADAAFLNIGMNAERPKETDASPLRRKWRADQRSIDLCSIRGDVRSAMPRMHVVAIAPEGLRIGSAKKSSES